MENLRNDAMPGEGAGRFIPVLFTVTIFLSASLLFFVQPLFAKIVLPQIGGTPAVWTTAMLFFQTVLIAGYAYAHFSTRYLPVLGQMGLHMVLWAVALLFLPLSIRTGVSFDADAPVALQTLLLFAAGVGAPFAVLSANAPLIQSWYAKTGGPSADDPYFLYGASNLGSLGALLAFPLIAEPLFGARQIGLGWSVGFVLLGAFLVSSGLAARRGDTSEGAQTSEILPRPSTRTTAFWLLLAFIPSSMMLTVTAKISRDVGSFPLIWVVPLALYLLTFVLTFTNKPLFGNRALQWMLAGGVAFFGFILTEALFAMNWWMVVGMILAFFGITMKAHRALYDARPDKSQLTYFYMVMSIGGALGGLFNSIIAPTLFNDLYETRIIVLLAVVLFFVDGKMMKRRDLIVDMGLASVILAPFIFFGAVPFTDATSDALYAVAVMFVVAMIAATFMRVPLVVTTITVLGVGVVFGSLEMLFKDRSFFGTHQVIMVNEQHTYINGNTVHGSQFIEDFGRDRPRPLSYYHAATPMGQIMSSDFAAAKTDIGVVGLGVGSLACYTQPGQNWQYYEIDALVEEVARNPDLFTFMSSCAADAPVHLGDARVVLERQTDVDYDILVLDAYSSDAIPVHLSTNEAIDLFRNRIKPGGILVFHISNRYYDMSLPLARSAAELGLVGRFQNFVNDDNVEGASNSFVVIFAEDDAALASFDQDGRWEILESDGAPAFTDDYANILSVLR